MRNCLTIANITFKEIVRQPLFYVIIFSSIVLMLLSSCFTLFAFGEEGKLVKDMGLTTITISGLIIAIFYTACAFTDELKKTTVVTILCKAVNKAGFIIGKFLGTALVVVLVNVILVVVFAFITSFYSVWGDAGDHQHSFFKGVYLALDKSLLLGIYFAFLQVLILGAISLLLSVLLPAVSNISICFAIYIFGHLSDYLNTYVQKSEGFVMWLPKIILSIIPNLQFFDIQIFMDNTSQNHDIFFYLLVTSFYTICYCAIMIVFTIFSFQRKDIL
ncbi:MAG: hypothetical protein ACUZ8E_18370 [Candidatus Anammoxibacter sp.]